MNRLFAGACGGLLIAGLTAGCGTARPPSAARPATASALQQAPRATVTAIPAGTTLPSGGPAPAGFRAASVTFVSTREAFVLGTAPCQHARCTSIVRTRDRGVSWRALPAPVVPLGEPGVSSGRAVWGIRFATPEYGFVFGNGLWVTTDGGKHWSAAAYPGGSIVSLEIIDHQVLAVTMHSRDGRQRELGTPPAASRRRGMDPARNASQRDREHRHPGAGGGDHRRHLRAGHR